MRCVRILALALLGISLAECREPGPFSPAEEANSLELQEWLEIWRADVPDLSAESFEFVGGGEFDPRARREIAYSEYFSEYLEGHGVSWEKMRRSIQISPDGRWALDHLIFNIVARDGILYEARGPNSEVALIDLDTMQAYSVAQGGTTVIFHRPIWVSPDVFLILSSNWYGDLEGRRLGIRRYDVGSGESSEFRGPQVSIDRSSQAWGKLMEWNRKRYADIVWR